MGNSFSEAFGSQNLDERGNDVVRGDRVCLGRVDFVLELIQLVALETLC